MKSLRLTLLIMVVSVTAAYTQTDQFMALLQLEGTWALDREASTGGMEMPELNLRCERVTDQNGMYCTVSVRTGDSYTLVQSELFAYDQANDKIFLMLFDGPRVTRGEGTFEGNVFRYSDYDASGNLLLNGSIKCTRDQLIQEIKLPGETGGTLNVLFNRTE